MRLQEQDQKEKAKVLKDFRDQKFVRAIVTSGEQESGAVLFGSEAHRLLKQQMQQQKENPSALDM